MTKEPQPGFSSGMQWALLSRRIPVVQCRSTSRSPSETLERARDGFRGPRSSASRRRANPVGCLLHQNWLITIRHNRETVITVDRYLLPMRCGRYVVVSVVCIGSMVGVTGCGSSTKPGGSTTTVIELAPSSASTASLTAPSTVTVTASSSSAETTSTSATTAQPTTTRSFAFPADARATCLTAGYNQRIGITNPGLRTQAAHKTTCGFLERVGSLVRADLYKHPDETSVSLSVYSSAFDRNQPLSCSVTNGIATCSVDGSTEELLPARSTAVPSMCISAQRTPRAESLVVGLS